MAHAGGRPLKFKETDEYTPAMEEYFETIPREEWSVTGLALAAGFSSRKQLIEYSERKEFRNTIRRAKMMIEHAYEMKGVQRGNAFDIFRLKNMGWVDKTETDVTTKGEALNMTPDPITAAAFADFLKGKK